jgi:hypothetical protein
MMKMWGKLLAGEYFMQKVADGRVSVTGMDATRSSGLIHSPHESQHIGIYEDGSFALFLPEAACDPFMSAGEGYAATIFVESDRVELTLHDRDGPRLRQKFRSPMPRAIYEISAYGDPSAVIVLPKAQLRQALSYQSRYSRGVKIQLSKDRVILSCVDHERPPDSSEALLQFLTAAPGSDAADQDVDVECAIQGLMNACDWGDASHNVELRFARRVLCVRHKSMGLSIVCARQL